MKANLAMFILFIFLSAFCLFSAGCANLPTVICDVLGTSHADLEKARAGGITKEINLDRSQAFDKVLEVLKENKIDIYQKDPKKGYIVALGFPKQTDTTRVGIFFEPAGTGKTTITLSSLSTTALEQANVMILGWLDKKMRP